MSSGKAFLIDTTLVHGLPRLSDCLQAMESTAGH